MVANGPEDQEHLPKGSHRIIPDVPTVLPQSPQNPRHRTGNIVTAATEGPDHGDIWGNATPKISDQAPRKRRGGGSLPREKARTQDFP